MQMMETQSIENQITSNIRLNIRMLSLTSQFSTVLMENRTKNTNTIPMATSSGNLLIMTME